MLLQRGVILLIAGGVLIVAGFSTLGYYGLQLVSNAQEQNKYQVGAGESVSVSKDIEKTGPQQGAYVVSFPEGTTPLRITVTGPSNETIVEKTIGPPIIIEAFPVLNNGVYYLTVTNPSNETVEASAVLGDSESLIASNSVATISMSLIGGGIIVIVAGIVISFMDKRHRSQMKQFGDNSDLV